MEFFFCLRDIEYVLKRARKKQAPVNSPGLKKNVKPNYPGEFSKLQQPSL